MSTTLDAVSTIAVITTFAVLVTVHFATIYGLAVRRHAGFALGGFVLPPVAPVGAFMRGMRVRGVLWIVALVLYAVALLLAR